MSVLKRVRDIVLWLMHLPPFVFSLISVVGIFYEEGGGAAKAALIQSRSCLLVCSIFFFWLLCCTWTNHVLSVWRDIQGRTVSCKESRGVCTTFFKKSCSYVI